MAVFSISELFPRVRSAWIREILRSQRCRHMDSACPTVFFQGVGQSDRPFDNKALGFFAQDSWKISSKLTLNYGLRYDIEFLPVFTPVLR